MTSENIDRTTALDRLEPEAAVLRTEVARLTALQEQQSNALQRRRDELAEATTRYENLKAGSLQAQANGRKSATLQQRKRASAQWAITNGRGAIGQLLSELSQTHASLRRVRRQLSSVERTIAFHEAPVYTGAFPASAPVTATLAQSILELAPPAVHTLVRSTRYRDIVHPTLAPASVLLRPAHRQHSWLDLFRYPIDLPPAELEAIYRRSILTCLGYLLHERLLTPRQRVEWNRLYHETLQDTGQFVSVLAAASPRDDCADCFRLWCTEPEALQRHFEPQYRQMQLYLEGLAA